MRPLIIDDRLKAAAKRIVAYASEHPYILGETIVPGDDPHYVLRTDFGYRCVFSYTRTPQGYYRDLSVSVSSPDKYPSPIAFYAIAQLFGFTGWDGHTIEPPPEDWAFAKDLHFNAIRVVQAISE